MVTLAEVEAVGMMKIETTGLVVSARVMIVLADVVELAIDTLPAASFTQAYRVLDTGVLTVRPVKV